MAMRLEELIDRLETLARRERSDYITESENFKRPAWAIEHAKNEEALFRAINILRAFDGIKA